MSVIAVMQPYFMPYAGYFRLFPAADAVVLFDCVQFPRRGWVHRNRLPDHGDAPRWLTLPLRKAPREALIADLAFADDARERMAQAITPFPSLCRARDAGDRLVSQVLACGGSCVAYLENLLRETTGRLGLPFATVRSSSLGLPPELKGADRVIAAVKAMGGRVYINPPGGRELYERSVFERAGIELRFLEPYRGSDWSILHRLVTEPDAAIAAEIRQQC